MLLILSWLSVPATKLDKPLSELKAFGKTVLLKPGLSQTIHFNISAKDLAFFYSGKSAWIAEAGNYVLKIGASSEDIKLSKSFSVVKEILVEKVNKALAPQVIITELKK